MPCSRFSASSSSITRRVDSGSSEATGSSASSTCAPCTSARATAARCCCPPDSVEARWKACGARPTACKASSARARSSRVKRAVRARHSGSSATRPVSTLVSSGRRPTRLNCWKTMPMRRRSARTSGLSTPPLCSVRPKVRTSPPSASSVSRPHRQRSSVDLPEPDAPSSATRSPGRTEKVTPASARRTSPPDGKVLCACRTLTAGVETAFMPARYSASVTTS